jgi:hypothetical protein
MFGWHPVVLELFAGRLVLGLPSSVGCPAVLHWQLALKAFTAKHLDLNGLNRCPQAS